MPLGDTDITYDDANRLVTQSGPEDLEFNYDPVGNVTSVTNANGTTTYDYTEINMLSGLRDPQGAETVYTYDALEGTWRDEADYPKGGSEPTTSRRGAGQLLDVVLAVYAVVFFAALAGTFGAFFLERRADGTGGTSARADAAPG